MIHHFWFFFGAERSGLILRSTPWLLLITPLLKTKVYGEESDPKVIYSNYNKEKSIEYAVTHPKWEQLQVVDYKIDVDFENIYGTNFRFLQDLKPTSAFLALGSKITIEGKKTIK